ncbi:carboxymethylenebutenolidase homolog isoform X2 [Neoarius graeffei]|uniref:carboxymethylenebutenolidase homolog isoform X2 n=1 Tax=Neoarius graeffei TaxID=443677 RepID=UPI00298D12F2|nr:carboxymethylenebutenolidase homolog isoform X2 [Neoarius graeffei]
MAKSMWMPDQSYPYVLVEHPIPDLVPSVITSTFLEWGFAHSVIRTLVRSGTDDVEGLATYLPFQLIPEVFRALCRTLVLPHQHWEVDVVLKYLKKQRGAKSIGVVGFCWGGVATHYIALQYPEVKAGVSVYGIIQEQEDRYELKSPTLFIFGEKDTVIPLDQVTSLEAKLKDTCTVDFKVKIFPNQTHGFVHRKREDVNPADRPYIQEAREDMINWLNKYM